MKIALIEAGHWHAPLYLDGLRGGDVEVIAVSDKEAAGHGVAIAQRFGARFYPETEALLASERPDFAFAFGRPAEMPSIGARLIAAGIPFALEKPCGTKLADVVQLAEQAEAADHFAAVPFLYRVGPLKRLLGELAGGLPGRFIHMSFRFIGGPPARYLDNGCPWMLDPAQSGGGPMMNLGGHFVDLFAMLAGEPATAVCSAMSRAAHGGQIEDYAVATLATATGALATIETGYTFPSAGAALREFSFTLRSEQHYVTSCPDGVEVRAINAPSEPATFHPIELRNEYYYPMFVEDTLERFRAGKAPACGLSEAVDVMAVMEQIYAKAQPGPEAGRQ